ncbi:MAG: cupredoxin domain-containing protein [Candidatus Aenigmarchaeota archaeon]|nr:cupredoxin domain-containing protein [Candidatus Aenigmarchaeota archaeon]
MDNKIVLIVGLCLIIAAISIGYFAVTGNATQQPSNTSHADENNVKEFHLESFYTMEDGNPHPQFSVKNITVNKGDFVRIYVNTTKGTHDFNIDELNVHKQTPTGQITTIEFIADKSGEFVYYCSMPGHRQNGHWGTLTIVE